MQNTIIDEIRPWLEKNPSTFYSSSKPRSISLRPDNTVDDSQIAKWELKELRKGIYSVLMRDSSNNLVARLTWDGESWKGSGTVGKAELVTGNELEIKKLLANNKKVDFRFVGREQNLPQRVNLDYNMFDLVPESSVERDTAVAIIGCDRPTYMMETVNSLKDQLKDYPVYVFLDKQEQPSNYDFQIDQQKQILSAIPHAVVLKRQINFGCGLNIIDARDQLLHRRPYSKLFVFEDDMVVSSRYMKFCENLWEWGKQYNVGAVQGWSNCKMSDGEKRRNASKVFSTFENLWGYCISKECWAAIREDILTYSKHLTDRVYSARDHYQISKWFKSQIGFEFKGQYPEDKFSKEQDRRFRDNIPTGQDGATQLLMRKHGFTRLAPVVTRARYIGKLGIHANPDFFRKAGYDMVQAADFSTDDSRKTFSPR